MAREACVCAFSSSRVCLSLTRRVVGGEGGEGGSLVFRIDTPNLSALAEIRGSVKLRIRRECSQRRLLPVNDARARSLPCAFPSFRTRAAICRLAYPPRALLAGMCSPEDRARLYRIKSLGFSRMLTFARATHTTAHRLTSLYIEVIPVPRVPSENTAPLNPRACIILLSTPDPAVGSYSYEVYLPELCT